MRHTVSFLRSRFEQAGLAPVTKYGQNFLIDLNLQDLILSSANVDEKDIVLEVGTGTGAITAELAQKAKHVVTVEIDPYLYQMAREEMKEHSNVTMLKQDALHNKNRLHPNVMAAVKKAYNSEPNLRFKLVANLPYNVATPIISNLLTTEIVPDLMSVTIQKELAQKIVAKPTTSQYNALSIWMQALCNCEIIRFMPPSVFWPAPKVDSAILRIQPDPKKRAQIPNLRYFHQLVRALFFHRRKFLRANLLGAFKGILTKSEVDNLMESQGLAGNCRAEELNVGEFIALCEGAIAVAPDFKL